MCDCITKVNQLLEKHNTKLDIPITFSFNADKTVGPLQADRISIATVKINTRKSGYAKKVIPAYCPFCGEEYKDQSNANQKTN